MYAVVVDGNKQFVVKAGDVVELDLRHLEPESKLELDRVLLLSNDGKVTIGQPVVAGAKVLATLLEITSEKTRIMKYRRRKNYIRRKGHRQYFSKVRIDEIVVPVA
ncbi:MAG: 50S ribosomal protein L21 [Planctomycetota bacterium]|nr:50S ribosomal protein L21 [Planctomycetota bacterium]RLS40554.1 MAG: 50S ribosomal protein L21 [Planctomycetota bacterium]